MPRKPSSFFLITEQASAPGLGAALPGGVVPLQVQRIPIPPGMDSEQVAKGYMYGALAGTRFYLIEDHKVDGYEVKLDLEPVDDPRLPEDDEPKPHRPDPGQATT